jgi:hypothetical protein
MAISGQQVIAVGLQNESANSDSLYTAFNKTVDNFATLFACASPYNTFTGNSGISVNTNSNTNTITITNTGVLRLTAGDDSINLTGSNGNITITATGGGNGGGGVSSVGVSSSTLTVSNSPILSAGNIVLNLTSTGITPGTYSNPTLGVDSYGRVTSIVNNTVAGTVTSVGITPGSGILVTNSPITSSGSITVTNTGVTRIAAGSGISVTGSNGDVTISTTASGGTVTGVTITSTSLTVTGGTITSSGAIAVDLPSAITIAGNITAGNVLSNGRMILNGSEDLVDGAAANLLVTASYFSTSTAETATLAAGVDGQIKTFMMVADAGLMVITVDNAGWKPTGTGTITFNDVGDSCTLQYIANKWFCIGVNGVTFN